MVKVAPPPPEPVFAQTLDGESEGPYEDLDAFLNRADELAESLLAALAAALALFDPITVHLEGVGTVLQLILLTDGVGWELARLTHRHEAGIQVVGDNRAEHDRD